jgi:hypothetical protein
MVEAFTPAQRERTDAKASSERSCLVSGATLSKDDLIRFVVGPDHIIVPDIAHKLGGRGLWVTADREILLTAIHKNLFSKAAKEKVTAGDDLLDLVITLLRRRCLELLGLARRSGTMFLGETQVDTAIRAGKVKLLLVADDAKQVLDNRANIMESRLFSRHELGACFGYDQIVYVGLGAQALTDMVRHTLVILSRLMPADDIPKILPQHDTMTHEGYVGV